MYKIVLTLGMAALLCLAACSRKQSDWEKTRAANTTDAYELFLKKYPNGEFGRQAQARLKELYEERDWQKARDTDSAEAYQAFLKQHPEGKWSEEARIRIENFTLASAPSNSPSSAPEVAASEAAAPATTPATTPAAPTAANPPPDAASVRVNPPPAAAAASPAAAPRAVAPKVAAAKAAGAPVRRAGDYAVQLGAFKSGEEAANAHWTHLSATYPKLLRALSPKVTQRQESTGTVYRLQVVNLSDRRAHSICKSLKAHSQDCMVLSPHG